MKFIGYFLLICFILFLVVLTGCSTMPKKIETIPPPTETWNKVVYQTHWLVPLSILGIMGGVFVLILGIYPKIGIATIITNGIGLFISLAIAKFAWWMALIGLIGLLSTIGLVVYSIFIKDKAIKELIIGAQELKESVSPIFTKEETNKILTDGIQTKNTQKIIQKVKTDLKVKGEL